MLNSSNSRAKFYFYMQGHPFDSLQKSGGTQLSFWCVRAEEPNREACERPGRTKSSWANQGLRSLQFTSPLEFNAIFRDGITLRLESNSMEEVKFATLYRRSSNMSAWQTLYYPWIYVIITTTIIIIK